MEKQTRKEEIEKGCGRKLNNGYEYSVCGEWSEIHKQADYLCRSCRARLDERIRAEQEIQEILLEHTQLTYEVGKLKEQLTKLNAKNKSHITRQRNELAKLNKTAQEMKA
jgi:hypothetical protein